MFNTTYPLFERGRILKIEMLEALRDFPRDLLNIYLKDYEDGILVGCEITTKNQFLVIQPGIILLQGVIYMLREPYQLAYLSNNRVTVLKVKCMGENKEKDFIRSISQIYLDYNVACKESEIELCRFKLKEGARLRSEHKNFFDFNTEYDTINRVHAPYLSSTGMMLPPEMMMAFASEALLYTNLEVIDTQFCFLILQNKGIIERVVLETYLRLKGENAEGSKTNEAFYFALTRILQDLEIGGKRGGQKKGFGQGIWID